MRTPADWEQVRRLFHDALVLPPGDRAAFLRLQLDEDGDTYREVASLLAAHPAAEGFLSDGPGRIADDKDSLPPAARFLPGARLGAFEIIGPLGSGGMADVYRARDTRLDRDVAIKVLSRELADDPRSRDRFEREAKAVSRLTHPHICTLYDVGVAGVESGDAQFLVMELLDGETLADRLHRGPLPVSQAIQVSLEILDALAAAHSEGIVHRDLKPANIMLTRTGVKLLDFGLARLHDRGRAGVATGDHAAGTAPLTAPGLVFGTVPYMAPEQVRGTEADARTDLFAFGAVLYEMLTGRRAFNASSQPALIAAILEQDPPPLAVDPPLASPALDRLVRACLAKDPAERWQHARDVAIALRGLAEGRADASVPARAESPGRGTSSSGLWRTWRLHAAWSAISVVAVLAVWSLASAPRPPAVPANPQPVIVLMDSQLEGRVYDPRTFAAGGTNADDISDALSDLPVVTYKENTSPMWHREDQVRQQNPDLIVSHLSCFLDQRVSSERAIRDHLFIMAHTRLSGFFGYLATVNPRTKFLVYSRGRLWNGRDGEKWTGEVIARFPQLQGRLFLTTIAGGDKASFRDPATTQQLRAQVSEILALRK
jgi:serine/threonine protein kinase